MPGRPGALSAIGVLCLLVSYFVFAASAGRSKNKSFTQHSNHKLPLQSLAVVFDFFFFLRIFKVLVKHQLAMITIHPQYIKDSKGKKTMVILPAKEFSLLIEELEELSDIKLYDQAKEEDSGERIMLSDYLKKRKKKRA